MGQQAAGAWLQPLLQYRQCAEVSQLNSMQFKPERMTYRGHLQRLQVRPHSTAGPDIALCLAQRT